VQPNAEAALFVR